MQIESCLGFTMTFKHGASGPRYYLKSERLPNRRLSIDYDHGLDLNGRIKQAVNLFMMALNETCTNYRVEAQKVNFAGLDNQSYFVCIKTEVVGYE